MNTTVSPVAPQASPRLGTDLALAALVVAVIVMMALPLPEWVIDLLVGFNISVSIVLLLLALFVPTPLAFSTFPSVLLITTLFRISLSVATTRQILLHGEAGDIIATFGKLVVGGSLVVGLVVFFIITIVQFIVIAKGAERVAEVGARFTLDALPGKQMSIDADLRAGVISQAEALSRRSELVRESQFFGAMDGAMKFVKGDAVAGIVIVLVNLIGGIAIGTLSMDLSMAESVRKFSVLSIGDGLVTQIPSLFVAIAAGVAITRTAPDQSANLGQQIAHQLGGQPRALMLAAGVMFLFMLVPGFPKTVFLVMGAATAATAVLLQKQRALDLSQRNAQEVPAAAREGESMAVLLEEPLPATRPPSAFRVELSADLAARWTAGGLDTALVAERRRWRLASGLPFPGVVLLVAAARAPDRFAVLVQDVVEVELALPEGRALALAPPPAPTADAPPTPAVLAPCHWVDAEAADALREAGTEVLAEADVMARVLTAVMQRHAGAVLGVQEVKQMLRELEARHGDLVREAQAVLPLPRMADMVTTLARESVPLTDLRALLQAIVTHGPGASDTNAMYEAARLALARAIVARLLPPGGAALPALSLAPALEQQWRAALVSRPDGPVLGLAPEAAEAARRALADAYQRASPPVRALALPPDLRRAASRLFRNAVPQAAFLSHEELAATGVTVQSAGRVEGPAATA